MKLEINEISNMGNMFIVSKDSLFFIGYPQCLTGDDEMNVH